MTDETNPKKPIPAWMETLLDTAEQRLGSTPTSMQPYWYRSGGREQIQRVRSAAD